VFRYTPTSKPDVSTELTVLLLVNSRQGAAGCIKRHLFGHDVARDPIYYLVTVAMFSFAELD
jgi:hypothetical protein